MGQGTTISRIKEEIIQQEKQIEGILLEIENLRIMKKQCKNWLFFCYNDAVLLCHCIQRDVSCYYGISLFHVCSNIIFPIG